MPRNRGRQSVAGLLPGCLSTLFLLAGCSTTAPIPDAFPDPVVSPIQMSVGVRYTDDFRSYTHTEAAPGEHKWVVTMGSANVAMFQSVLGSMFAETVELDLGEGLIGDDRTDRAFGGHRSQLDPDREDRGQGAQ